MNQVRVSGAIVPKQRRSSETLSRILDTVERMLPAAGSLDALSLNELCAEADVSRSSFYARFKSKDDMVPALCQRYANRATAIIESAFTTATAAGIERPATFRGATEHVLRSHLVFQRSLEILDAAGDDPRVLNVRLEVTRLATNRIRQFLEIVQGRSLTRDDEVQLMFLVCVIGTSMRPDGAVPHLVRLLGWSDDDMVRHYADLACAHLGIDGSAVIVAEPV